MLEGGAVRKALLIAGIRNPVLVDYACHCLRQGRQDFVVITGRERWDAIPEPAPRYRVEDFSPADFWGTGPAGHVERIVLFLDGRLTARGRALLDAVALLAAAGRTSTICIVSSFRVHLGDRAAASVEALALERLRGLPARLVVLRPSHVLSRSSRLGRFLRNAWYCFPLVPGRLQGCCVEEHDLFAAIDRELSGSGPPAVRTYTLLGTNRSWQTRFREKGPARTAEVLARASLLLAALHLVISPLVRCLARWSPVLRPWHVEMLQPRSLGELLTLYNKYSYGHIKIVGYNNGVVHFGQRHPGKTIVSTVGCQRLRVRGTTAVCDAGVTIRQARDALRPGGKELPVLPNYSYVSLGTAFFVPIHGSASQESTIADTIEKVVLYDPGTDRLRVARRGDPVFGQYLYNLSADVLLLRLRLRTKEKSHYYVKRHESDCPSSDVILNYFHDREPTNVEVRKAGSAAEKVSIFQYFTHREASDGAALDLPRDALGRVWDRLEENPLSRVVFHGLVRRFAYHVEMFLSEEEFATFWDTHRALPLKKIQLRFIRRDGFPNSPFRLHDCVAADLFLLKKHREAFERYRKEKLRAAALNPGKHTA
jgi:hypothetical protein